MVRFEIGDHEKKRPVGVPIDKSDSHIGQCVDPVAGQPHFLHITVIQDAGVGVRTCFGPVGRKPFLVPAAILGRHLELVECEVPLSKIASMVPGDVKVIGKGLESRLEPKTISLYVPLSASRTALSASTPAKGRKPAGKRSY